MTFFLWFQHVIVIHYMSPPPNTMSIGRGDFMYACEITLNICCPFGSGLVSTSSSEIIYFAFKHNLQCILASLQLCLLETNFTTAERLNQNNCRPINQNKDLRDNTLPHKVDRDCSLVIILCGSLQLTLHTLLKYLTHW